MEEGAMYDQNMSAEKIRMILESKRNANIDGLELLNLTSFMFSKGETNDLVLGDHTFNYLNLSVSGGKKGAEPLQFDPLFVNPAENSKNEIATPEGQSGDFNSYTFHRYDKRHPYMGEIFDRSTEPGVSIFVKKQDAIELEKYLFGTAWYPESLSVRKLI